MPFSASTPPLTSFDRDRDQLAAGLFQFREEIAAMLVIDAKDTDAPDLRDAGSEPWRRCSHLSAVSG
jgi:hypothetical protein